MGSEYNIIYLDIIWVYSRVGILSTFDRQLIGIASGFVMQIAKTYLKVLNAVEIRQGKEVWGQEW